MKLYPLLTPPGNDTEIMYNDSGLFGGDSALTWDDATKALTLGSCAVLGPNSAVFQPAADSTTFFQILDADGGTPVFNVNSTNERIGIGTASPSTILDVTGLTTQFRLTHTTGVDYADFVVDSDGYLMLETSGEKITFQGNFGVGTLNPVSPLHIRSDTGRLIFFQPVTGTNAIYARMLNTGGDFYFGVDSSAGGLFTGVNPYAGFMMMGGADDLHFGTNSTVYLTIKSDGAVLVTTIKSGATQAGAGAAANELWKTASHATLPDNVVMIGM